MEFVRTGEQIQTIGLLFFSEMPAFPLYRLLPGAVESEQEAGFPRSPAASSQSAASAFWIDFKERLGDLMTRGLPHPAHMSLQRLPSGAAARKSLVQ